MCMCVTLYKQQKDNFRCGLVFHVVGLSGYIVCQGQRTLSEGDCINDNFVKQYLNSNLTSVPCDLANHSEGRFISINQPAVARCL